MPTIKKPKKSLKKTVSRSRKALPKPKNTLDYYQCIRQQAKQGLKGKKITNVCHDCKHNALAINAKISAVKAQAAQKIKVGYETMGKGLAELIEASK